MLSPDLKQRILQAADSEPAPARRQVATRVFVLTLLAMAVPLIGFWLVGAVRPSARPPALIAATALGAFVMAGVAVWISLGRGRSMLGRPRSRLLAVAILAPLGFLLWKIGWSAQFDQMSAAWPDRPGYRCFSLTLLFAVAPLVVFAFLRRRSDPAHPASLGLALGVAAGMTAATLVDLWCPVGHAGHVLASHVLPMGLLGLVGVVVGHLLIALR